MKKTFHGQHRSLALAEKHRALLEKGLGVKVVISARRNAAGNYSSRGQHFTFKAMRARKVAEMTLREYEEYMQRYRGPVEDQEIETSGDYGDEE